MGLEQYALHARVNELTRVMERHQRALRSLTGWACAVCFLGSFMVPWVTEVSTGFDEVSVRSRNIHTFIFPCSDGACEKTTEDGDLALLWMFPIWAVLIGLALLVLASSEEAAKSAAHRQYQKPGMAVAVLGLMLCLVHVLSLSGSPDSDQVLVGPALPLLALAVVCVWVRSTVPHRPYTFGSRSSSDS